MVQKEKQVNVNFNLNQINYWLINYNKYIQNKIKLRMKAVICALFWTLLRMLYRGDIFLLSRSNKNVITRQKKSFLRDTKKLCNVKLSDIMETENRIGHITSHNVTVFSISFQ